MDDLEDDGITTTSSSGLDSIINSSIKDHYYNDNEDVVVSNVLIERNDSDIDVDREEQNKIDGDGDLDGDKDFVSADIFPCYPLCLNCEKRRNERKEIISEIIDTELKYGRDLRIILEEFAKPIKVAGLLTQQQVDDIFLNIEELIEVNCHLADCLQDAFEIAIEQGDEDLISVNIGQLFNRCLLDKISVFERYCIRQASASLLLNQLEKEKELLRIFLRVSQMENALLRRMNLRSFLVVPVQRVTKYPLLLNRLQKVTPKHFVDCESLRETQMKLEIHLDSINQKTRDSLAATTSKIWRRISNLSSASMKMRSNNSNENNNLNQSNDFGFVKLKKASLDLLKWPCEESKFVLIGKLSFIVEKSGSTTGSSGDQNISPGFPINSSHNYSTISNNSTASKIWSKTMKFLTAHAVLIIRTSSNRLRKKIETETLRSSTSTSVLETLDHHEDFVEFNESFANNTFAKRRSSSKSPIRVTFANTFSVNQQSSADDGNESDRHQNDSIRKSSLSRLTPAHNEAMLILFKEKNGRYSLCRDILNLAMCVIANFDNEEFFEIHDLESKESLLLKTETNLEMREWLKQLRLQSKNLGQWRRRRNALPNIMVLKNMNDSMVGDH
ncbi:Rho/RAC guanine nucleotide exchange factor-like protein 2 [Sarcoptes scabiei]|uniref:Rho/RAC guanine nucleotide exchange factor-like protein 2 n=1 Tax=Sarcoptes scabiei TaxID=52283 RepID=A0A132ALV2_SARSC|nr:Rho/RAC guanine nucleotide exchange factor-like protein 2 [Sarcoptes scabiei]